jgi:DHA1 family bicyclomycin/chloramphenicol resistance-like MFS transporter
LILLSGWRLIFAVLGIVAILGVSMTGFLLPETLERERRVPVNAATLYRGARILLRDPVFMGLTFIGGFGLASFFVFLASASFVYMGQFGLTPTGFSLAFAVNAVGFFAASQLAAAAGERFGAGRVISYAVAGFLLFTVSLLALTLAGYGALPVIVAFLFCANACLGLVIPTTMVMALDEHGEIAGLASSLGGTLQMLAGGAMIVAASPFFDATATPMVATIAFCALAAFVLTRLLFPRVFDRRDKTTGS